jgi:hypothetical protein
MTRCAAEICRRRARISTPWLRRRRARGRRC